MTHQKPKNFKNGVQVDAVKDYVDLVRKCCSTMDSLDWSIDDSKKQFLNILDGIMDCEETISVMEAVAAGPGMLMVMNSEVEGGAAGIEQSSARNKRRRTSDP